MTDGEQIERRIEKIEKRLDHQLKTDKEEFARTLKEIENKLDKRQKSFITNFVAVCVVVTGLVGWWASGISAIVHSTDKTVGEIKQHFHDKGEDIVARVPGPSRDDAAAHKNPDFAQLLTQTQNELTQVADSGIKPQKTQIEKFQKVITTASTEHPASPQTWQAAAQLITLRSHTEAKTTNLGGGCFETEADIGTDKHVHGNMLPPGFIYIFHDCTLVLDDFPAFLNSKAWKYSQEKQPTVADQIRSHPPWVIFLRLINVHVIYHGGEIIPADAISFWDCTFDFQIDNRIPPDRGKQLTKELLMADLKKTEVKFANAPV